MRPIMPQNPPPGPQPSQFRPVRRRRHFRPQFPRAHPIPGLGRRPSSGMNPGMIRRPGPYPGIAPPGGGKPFQPYQPGGLVPPVRGIPDPDAVLDPREWSSPIGGGNFGRINPGFNPGFLPMPRRRRRVPSGPIRY